MKYIFLVLISFSLYSCEDFEYPIGDRRISTFYYQPYPDNPYNYYVPKRVTDSPSEKRP